MAMNKNIARSAEIIEVTPAEYIALEASARERGGCPCISCLAGEGDRLCVDCHYRYALIGNTCSKCYAERGYTEQEAWFAARVNALGETFGVADAYAKYQAEMESEWQFDFESGFLVERPHEWSTAKGRVVFAW